MPEDEIIDVKHMLDTLKKSRVYMEVFAEYRSAIMEVETKLRILDIEMSVDREKNPIETIQTRLKSPESILEKMERKGYPFTLESMRENLMDIAGIRVICDYIDDIYKLEKYLSSQDDIKVLDRDDYIRNPKPNGYRSLHLTVEVPIFLTGGPKPIPVEVQFRTMAMDFWASLEHKLKYKKHIGQEKDIGARLKKCADIASALDQEMLRIRQDIDSYEKEQN